MQLEDSDNFGADFDSSQDSDCFDIECHPCTECLVSACIEKLKDIDEDRIYRVPKSLDEDDEDDFQVTRLRHAPTQPERMAALPQKRQVQVISMEEDEESVPTCISE